MLIEVVSATILGCAAYLAGQWAGRIKTQREFAPKLANALQRAEKGEQAGKERVIYEMLNPKMVCPECGGPVIETSTYFCCKKNSYKEKMETGKTKCSFYIPKQHLEKNRGGLVKYWGVNISAAGVQMVLCGQELTAQAKKIGNKLVTISFFKGEWGWQLGAKEKMENKDDG